MAFLKWPDYIIFLITLVVSLGIGLFYSLEGRKQNSTTQYLFGDGKINIFAIALSLVVSYQSGIMMLGVPAEVYIYGFQWYMCQVGYFIASMIAINVLIPPLKQLNISSINQYLELRFGSRKLRLFVTIMNMLAMVNYLGTVTFAPAVALDAVSDLPHDWSVNGVMAVVVLYTFIGGFQAVVWTDVFQTILMFGGILAVLIKGTISAGGIKTTWDTITEKGRVNFFDFNPDPTIRQSFWSLVLGAIPTGISFLYYQTIFQRIKATPTKTSAKRMYLMAAIGSFILTLLGVLEGAIMFAYYNFKGCDPLADNQVTNENQLIVLMVTEIFENIPCLPGLFLASLFSASLSTMSSILSSLSALLVEDLIKPQMKSLSERKVYWVSKLSVFVFGGMGIFVSYIVSGLKGPVSQIIDTTDACLRGATAGIFLLGWLIPWANSLGALVGGLLSSVLVGWICYGKYTSTGIRINPPLEPASIENCIIYNTSRETIWNTSLYYETDSAFSTVNMSQLHEPQGVDLLYSVSYKWLTPISMVIVLVSGSILSRLQGKTQANPTLVLSIDVRRCFFIPRRFRTDLPYNAQHLNKNTTTVESQIEAESAGRSIELQDLMDANCQ